MHIYAVRFLKLAIIVSTFLIVGLSPFSANAFDILFGTGKTGTFSHFTGRTICRVIDRHSDNISCKTVTASDDVQNLTNLREGGLDIALIDSRMLFDAINKTGNFKFFDIGYENLRVLIPLYDVPITLVVRNDAKIASLEDLKGKRINAGAPLSLQHLAVDTIMKAKNWSKKDFSLIGELPSSMSQDTMAFCHGRVQGMLHIGVHPDSSLQKLIRLCKASLVSMDDNDIQKLVSDHPALWKISIAADTYPSISKGLTTFGTRAMMVASEELDEGIVYQILDAIYSNRDRLKSAHPSLSLYSVGVAQKSATGIKLHPGAVKYFSEQVK
jgi:hypothetical protein